MIKNSGKTNGVLKRSKQHLGRTGSAAVELLFVLPILLLLILAMVQVGMLMAAQQQLQLASREAARVAALGGTKTEVEDAAKIVLGKGVLSQATIASVLTDSDGKPLPSGAAVIVEVSMATKAAVPNFVAWSGVVLAGETISGRTVMRKE